MITLENNYLRVLFDDRGRVTSIVHKMDENRELLSRPSPHSFFMNLAGDTCKECLVYEEMQTIHAQADGTCALFKMEKLLYTDGRRADNQADISLTLKAELEEDSILFTAEVDNRTDMYVLDFDYPNIGIIKELGDGKPTLFWPYIYAGLGSLYMNVGEMLSEQPPHRDHGSNTLRAPYPGLSAVGVFGLFDRKNSVFVSTEDPDFIACELKVIGNPEDKGALTLTVDKHLCCKNTCLRTAPVRVRVYKGDWHRAAKCYGAWMSNYRPKHPTPDWIREMRGYFLVINKQQFGYEMWDYSTLPKLYELAQSYGFNTLGLFGWYESGHDNLYPDLEVGKSLGGEEMLKENIKKVQQAGGRVSLYFQGHLIDIGSEYYRSGKGKEIESINIWGEHYTEHFAKSHQSSFLCEFSGKRFSLSCPSCPEWIELMAEKERWIASLGADAVLYDQIGGMPPYPCFNENHPHDGNNPARSMSGGRRKMMHKLQTQAKELSPDFAFMSEHFSDLYSAYLDAVHGSGYMPGSPDEHSFEVGGETGVVCFPDFVLYAFPDIILTGRNPKPYAMTRFMNYTFLYNLIPEMEVRFKADKEDVLKDKYHEERIYSASVIALRDKYRAEMIKSTYTDTDGISNPDKMLVARGYAVGDTLLVNLWNDADHAITPHVTVDGKRLVSFETADGKISAEPRPLEAQEIAVAVYK